MLFFFHLTDPLLTPPLKQLRPTGTISTAISLSQCTSNRRHFRSFAYISSATSESIKLRAEWICNNVLLFFPIMHKGSIVDENIEYQKYLALYMLLFPCFIYIIVICFFHLRLFETNDLSFLLPSVIFSVNLHING